MQLAELPCHPAVGVRASQWLAVASGVFLEIGKSNMKFIRSLVRFPLSSHAESSSACRAADTARTSWKLKPLPDGPLLRLVTSSGSSDVT